MKAKIITLWKGWNVYISTQKTLGGFQQMNESNLCVFFGICTRLTTAVQYLYSTEEQCSTVQCSIVYCSMVRYSAVQTSTAYRSTVQKIALICVCSKPPQTNLEWTQLLESQQRYHDDELQKWKEILESSVLLLYEVSRRVWRPTLKSLSYWVCLMRYDDSASSFRSSLGLAPGKGWPKKRSKHCSLDPGLGNISKSK